MHILYHHRTMARGAEGIHILNIVTEFQKLGHKITILSPPGVGDMNSFGNKPLDKSNEKAIGINKIWKLISKNAPQILFELLEIVYNFFAIYRLRKIVCQDPVNMIYERNAYYLFAGTIISLLYNIPLIVEVNEVVGVKSARKLKMKIVARAVEKFIFKHAHSIFTVSSFLKKKICIILKDDKKIYLTPNAINPETYSKERKRTELRKKYNFNDKIVIGFAGWFDWWDKLEITVDIQAKLLMKGYLNTVTMLVGDGPPMVFLKDRVKKLGIQEHVLFTGSVEKKDILDYIDAFDIGLFTHSNSFGSPIVLFEMMALKKCIVAPSLMPFTDVINHGVNGLLFPPLDQSNLFKQIESVVQDSNKMNEIGNQSFHTVMQNYTWEKNAKKILLSL